MRGYYTCLLLLVITCCTFIQARSLGLTEPQARYVSVEEQKQCFGYPCDLLPRVEDNLKILRRHQDQADSSEEHPLPPIISGDILPNPAHLDHIVHQLNATRKKRKLATFSPWVKKWRLPIAYQIDDSFNEEQKASIRSAISHLEDNTCVRFIASDAGDTIKQNVIVFTKSQRACASFVGKTLWFPQVILLTDKCVSLWGSIVHEIGHALGMWHEHQRADRDQYVDILSHNIDPSAPAEQLEMKGDTSDIEPYDYGSVMQYYAWAFSKHSRDLVEVITIRPKTWLYVKTMGQYNGLSFYDSKTINRAYCQHKCYGKDLGFPCENGGYQDPLDCSVCRCPSGFSGANCGSLQASFPTGCGYNIHLDDQSPYVIITSPGYAQMTSYEDRMHCSWLVTAPAGRRIVFKFDFDSPFSLLCSFPTCEHFVEVRYMSDLSLTGPRYCCDRARQIVGFEGSELQSESNRMLILFRSNYTSNSPDDRIGFSANVSLGSFLTMSSDDGSDSGSDEGSDSGSDDGSDSGSDDGSDSGSDDGSDSGSDDGSDSGSDDGSDSGSDDGSDSGSDDGSDSGSDDGSDSGSDDGSDSGSDDKSDSRSDDHSGCHHHSDETTDEPDNESDEGTKSNGETDSGEETDDDDDDAANGERPGADLAFILDSSSSIGEDQWETTKDFVKTVVASYADTHFRFGLVTFGTLQFDFDDLTTETQIHTLLDGLEWRNESRNTADGLRAMRTELFQSERGDRDDAPDLCVLLMDGLSDESETSLEASLARRDGTHIMVVGITAGAPPAQLVTIASSSASVFHVDTYDELVNITHDVTDRINTFAVNLVFPAETTMSTRSSLSDTTTSTTTVHTDSLCPSVINGTWWCDFEQNTTCEDALCGMTQDQRDQFDWTVFEGPTPSTPTGPDTAYSGDYYIYIETSKPRRPNDTAIIYLPPVLSCGNYCLQFHYNMHGFHINALSVFTTSPTDPVWRVVGEQGPKWFCTSLNLELTAHQKVGFSGTRGEEYSGDIALDKIQLHEGPCPSECDSLSQL